LFAAKADQSAKLKKRKDNVNENEASESSQISDEAKFGKQRARNRTKTTIMKNIKAMEDKATKLTNTDKI